MGFSTRIGLVLLASVPALSVWGRELREPEQAWKGQLADALKEADRIVIKRGGQAAQQPPVLWQIRGRKHVESFLAKLEIEDAKSGWIDGCDGDPHLHFYAGDSEVASLSWHHAKSIRWRSGKWRGDAWLAEGSQRAVPAWFAKHGYHELQMVRDRALARQRERDEQARSFASFFPEGAQEVLRANPKLSFREFDQYDQAAGEQIAAFVDDPLVLAVACCQALGVSTTTWSSTGPQERRVLAAVESIEGEDFLKALQTLQRNGESQRGLLGAARLFFRQDFDARLDKQQRSTWALILAEAVVRYGKASSKPQLLRYLALQREPAVKKFLHDVAVGKVTSEPDVHEAYRQEPDLRPGAVLALAQLGDRRAKELAAEQLKRAQAPQNVAAFEVSLALLGDPAYLKGQHFELKSYSLGYAALDAIERFKGAYCMEILVSHGIRHPWARIRRDSLKRFERITGVALTVEGRSRLEARQRMQTWWQQHGADFVRQRRNSSR